MRLSFIKKNQRFIQAPVKEAIVYPVTNDILRIECLKAAVSGQVLSAFVV